MAFTQKCRYCAEELTSVSRATYNITLKSHVLNRCKKATASIKRVWRDQ